MNEDRFRFRQIVKESVRHIHGVWHYWGFVDDGFVSPLGKNQGGSSYQSTGLRDKNGSLIFEGDIYETYWKAGRPDTGKYRKAVEWENEGLFNVSSYSFILDEVEVIGNIHENPELLEQ